MLVEEFGYSRLECCPGWVPQPDQEQARMGCGHGTPREGRILRQAESSFSAHGSPYLCIVVTLQPLVIHGVRIMPPIEEDLLQRRRQALIDLQIHAADAPSQGRSSDAEAAAYAIAARTSSGVRTGNAVKICSGVSPSARLASTVRSGTRVPRITASPPRISGSRTILEAKSSIRRMIAATTAPERRPVTWLGAENPARNQRRMISSARAPAP